MTMVMVMAAVVMVVMMMTTVFPGGAGGIPLLPWTLGAGTALYLCGAVTKDFSRTALCARACHN